LAVNSAALTDPLHTTYCLSQWLAARPSSLLLRTVSTLNFRQSTANVRIQHTSSRLGLPWTRARIPLAVWFLVPRIDTIFNQLTKKHNNEAKPEYRLPLANIGSLLIPISLFWFAWTVEFRVHWIISIASTFFYGIGQVAIFNTVQNYYIDSFEKYAASAIAAGALFRSVIGGVVPLLTPVLLENLGVGWGMSVFVFVSVLLAPNPLLFY
jgi:hypothetical protein